MPQDKGGPAFPHIGTSFNHDYGEREATTTEPGVSVRDYFAGKALEGFLANAKQDYAPLVNDRHEMIAVDAYRIADAMLKERNA